MPRADRLTGIATARDFVAVTIAACACLASGAAQAVTCRDAARADLDRATLSRSLDACFTEIGSRIPIPGGHIDRIALLANLSELEDPARRRTLFYALAPLWQAVNGANEPTSPYRRLIAASHVATQSAAPLEEILEIWRASLGGRRVEPWDYWAASGAVERALAHRIPRERLLPISKAYFRDLGADLDRLGVEYDLEPRANKSSVASTDFKWHGRYVKGQWQPSIARVTASYSRGGLGALNELVHENGHAVHVAAIHHVARVADWPEDTGFDEAFADVAAWSTYEPRWQRRYLGAAAPQAESLRALFSSIMLDIAWSVFEIRMLSEPKRDPNALWAEITSRYLGIVPHPEISWWAIRGQLVQEPGYMIYYGYGAITTADLRERTRELIGDFDTGNPRWYALMSEKLLRYGNERKADEVVREFLGRPVSPQALIRQLRRLQPGEP